MRATKSERHYYCCGENLSVPVLIPRNEIPDERPRLPSKNFETIIIGLCTDCRFLGACVWQHNNKLTCEHFK